MYLLSCVGRRWEQNSIKHRSSFEAAVDISNWLPDMRTAARIPTRKGMLLPDRHKYLNLFYQKFEEENIPKSTVDEWTNNQSSDGKLAFEHFEGLGFLDCIEKSKELHNRNSRAEVEAKLEQENYNGT